jgi:hypothetical protein
MIRSDIPGVAAPVYGDVFFELVAVVRVVDP